MTVARTTFLFAMPWQKASWPSLALGTLKAHLSARGKAARCCHFHLECAAAIGWARYDALAECWGAGDALFGALLDPDEADRLATLAADLLAQAGFAEAAQWASREGVADLSRLIETWLDRECPERFDLVGGSVGAMQLSATLYMMRRIRERGHRGRRVLGGSGLVGSAGEEVLRRSPDIDLVVWGEGETILDGIVEAIDREDPSALPVPGTLYREGDAVRAAPPPAPVDLTASVAPDFAEYFDAARAAGIPPTALNLSFEYSRGCAWEHRTAGRLRGCTFCGLYRNSPSHRVKPVADVVEQIGEAVHRHRILNLGFVDAYLPPVYRDELIGAINAMAPSLRYFTELRCDLAPESMPGLAQRVGRVQLGVESFSTPILRAIGKGLTGMQSVHNVRMCQDWGIDTQYNLMTDIPGIARETVQALAELLPGLFGLTPPVATQFYLDRNSLAFADPAAHGIRPDSLDRKRPDWLAPSLGDGRILQWVSFEPLDDGSAEAWEAVRDAIARWHDTWRTARAAGLAGPLTWQNGGDWSRVIDARDNGAQIYTLDGVLHAVLQACTSIQTQRSLEDALAGFPAADVGAAIAELVAHRLLFEENRSYVLVAARAPNLAR